LGSIVSLFNYYAIPYIVKKLRVKFIKEKVQA